MKRPIQRLFVIVLLLCTAVVTKAQEWTVFELPATLEEVPAKIRQQFGCTYQELSEKKNITRLKVIGTDFEYSWDYDGKEALHQLAVKAREVDLSEVVANPNQSFYSSYYEGPDPYYIVEYMSLRGLDSLRRVVYPKTLHHLAAYGGELSDCDNLTEVVWPDDIRELPVDMFSNCVSLTQMDIPATVRELPEGCFSDCKKLQKVTLHEGLQKIGKACFSYCEALKEVKIPESVTTIGASTFYRCSKLTAVTLPTSLTSIPNSMFEYCSSLSSIQIPAGVTEIGIAAFSGCTALKQITLPEGVVSIGNDAFYETSLVQVTMPDGVTQLGEYAFSNCGQLRKVHLSRGLTEIPACCFTDCQVLEEVNIPMRVTKIGREAFARCYLLPAPQLPDGLVEIDNGAFWDTRFGQIALPSNLKLIGNNCFRYSHLSSIEVPASVVQIGESAFRDCDSLRHATLYEGLLYLLNGAFADCKKLEDVALPNSLRVLGEEVFYGNKRKKSFVLPPLVNVVPTRICCGCENLSKVTLHGRVTQIEGNAFEDCNLTNIDLPEGLISIGSGAFVNCPLQKINLPSTLRVINERAFNNGKYSRVVVPEGVEEVWDRAFLSENLRYVEFPSTIAQLGNWSFQGDGSACDSIVLRATVPPHNWGGLYREWYGGALYVPAQSVEAYKHNPGFSGFNSIRPLSGYNPQNIVVATPVSTDSVWFPVINNANLTVTHNPDWGNDFYSGHLHVGNKVNWPVNHLRYDYQQAWQGYGWENQQPTATLINEGKMTAQSMEMNLRYSVNQWFYFTPPFDMKASDLTCNDPRTPFVLRTFDGSQRAAGNHGQTWTTVGSEDILQTGRGYILQYGDYRQQVSYDNWRNMSDDVVFNMKSSAPLRTLSLSSEPVSIPLAEHKAEFPHNEGWNMIANPYMAYFDIQDMESDAPILVVVRPGFGSFMAYSPIDDNLVLRPLEAFLIQRGNNQQAVVFRPEGRQNELPLHRNATNNARSMRRQQLRQDRVVYDAVLYQAGQQSDSAYTRIVVTPRATESYDRAQDAPFITMVDEAMALYTRSAGLRYSLNELPPTTQSVQIGMRIVEAGTYTLAFSMRGDRASASQHLWLKDMETGTETDLLSDSFTFIVEEPGTLNNRFVLQLNDGITAVEGVETAPSHSSQLYDLQGRPVSTPSKGIYIRNGKKHIQ